MNVDFIPSFIPEWNLDQVYMILNRHFIPDRVFDLEWKMEWTQSGMSCVSIQIHVNKYNSISYGLTETEWVRSGLQPNLDSCKHPPHLFTQE